MIILGINAYHGEVSAVLLRDGELVASVEESGPWRARAVDQDGHPQPPRQLRHRCLEHRGRAGPVRPPCFRSSEVCLSDWRVNLRSTRAN